MRILLTGSSGWLGRFLAPRLRAEGHQVVGLDLVPGPDTDLVGTVADRGRVEGAVRGCQAVIHAAALHKPDIVRYPRQAFIDVNVTGTLNLLEAAVAERCSRFVFTSTTSLMISSAIRSEEADHAVWLDEDTAPLEPRNVYGITKLSAEQLCRLCQAEQGMPVVVLRTSRFFPEDDDMAHTHTLSGPNLKANEFLHRRLTVEDACQAHLAALEKAPELGFGLFLVSAPTPFDRADAAELKRDAAGLVARYFPQASELYARQGWTLPRSLGRVYDARRAEKMLGFRCRTDFAAVLEAVRGGGPLPFIHDPSYVSPKEAPAAR